MSRRSCSTRSSRSPRSSTAHPAGWAGGTFVMTYTCTKAGSTTLIGRHQRRVPEPRVRDDDYPAWLLVLRRREDEGGPSYRLQLDRRVHHRTCDDHVGRRERDHRYEHDVARHRARSRSSRRLVSGNGRPDDAQHRHQQIGGNQTDSQETGAAGAGPPRPAANDVNTGTYYVSESGRAHRLQQHDSPAPRERGHRPNVRRIVPT